MDQNSLGALAKEQKHKSSGSEKKVDEKSSSKKSSTKTKGDQEKALQEAPEHLFCHQVSIPPKCFPALKQRATKATNLKEKSDSPKSTNGTPSGTPSRRKKSLQAQESPVSGGTKGKLSLTSTPQSSASPSPTSKKSSSERNSVSGKKKLVERGSSKGLGAHQSPGREV